MAEAYECDRCGVLYTKKDNDKPDMYVAKMDVCYCMRPLDLCFVCQSRFKEWWDAGKEGAKEKNEESEY